MLKINLNSNIYLVSFLFVFPLIITTNPCSFDFHICLDVSSQMKNYREEAKQFALNYYQKIYEKKKCISETENQFIKSSKIRSIHQFKSKEELENIINETDLNKLYLKN